VALVVMAMCHKGEIGSCHTHSLSPLVVHASLVCRTQSPFAARLTSDDRPDGVRLWNQRCGRFWTPRSAPHRRAW
jgi:hypothetical protein